MVKNGIMDNLAFDLPEEDNSLPPPQANMLLLGHDKAEKLLAKEIAAGRLPHALMIAGPKGIGKATLAFRLARYLLAGKAEEDASGLFGDAAPAESLAVDAEDRAAKLVAAGSHPNLFYIRPTDIDSIKNTKRANPFIGVSEARITRDFLSHTPSEKGWRVVLIDGAEDMRLDAQNALLKTLEEPPAKTVIILVTTAPGRFLPTVHSRCRMLPLTGLSDADMECLLDRALPDLSKEEKSGLLALADGSIGEALSLHETGGAEIYQDILSLLSGFSEADAHKLAAELAAKKDRFPLFMEILLKILSRAAKQTLVDAETGFTQKAPQKWFKIWEDVKACYESCDYANLDRQTACLRIFDLIRS